MRWALVAGAVSCGGAAVAYQPAAEPPPAPHPRFAAALTCPQMSSLGATLSDALYDPLRAQYLTMGVPVTPTTPRPVVLLIHGGEWIEGSRAQYAATQQTFGNFGYATAAIDYPLVCGAGGSSNCDASSTYPLPLNDVQLAINWVRSNAGIYNIDPRRVGVLGQSSGGYFAAFLGVRGDGKATVAYYTPFNLNSPGPIDLNFLGDADPDAASPISNIVATAPASPFLIVAGTADTLVDYSQSVNMLAALQDAGVDASLFTVDGGQHGFNVFDPTIPDLKCTVLNFFKANLSP